VPMAARRPLLLDALNHLYGRSKDLHYGCESEDLHYTSDLYGRPKDLHDGCEVVAQDFSPAVNVPWMSAPEDSWL
jgi:hypothetical protein